MKNRREQLQLRKTNGGKDIVKMPTTNAVLCVSQNYLTLRTWPRFTFAILSNLHTEASCLGIHRKLFLYNKLWTKALSSRHICSLNLVSDLT